MSKLYYEVEVRDEEGNLYIDDTGGKVVDPVLFEDEYDNASMVELICHHQVRKLRAICKKGSKINITVRTYSKLSKTYPLAYSYYGGEERFIEH